MIRSMVNAAARLALSRTPIWVWLPVYAAQGLVVRARTPWLPEAEGRQGSVGTGAAGEAGEAVRLAVVGDSVAAGVGLVHHEDTMTGLLASRLADTRGVRVDWLVAARTGLTSGGIRQLVADTDLGDPDVILLSVGANDTKDLHTVQRFRREFTSLLDTLRARAPRAEILVFGAAPMQHFPALRGPIGTLLGARAVTLDAAAQAVIAGRRGIQHLPLTLPDDPAEVRGLFAADGFHPGPALHADFAALAFDALPADFPESGGSADAPALVLAHTSPSRQGATP